MDWSVLLDGNNPKTPSMKGKGCHESHFSISTPSPPFLFSSIHTPDTWSLCLSTLSASTLCLNLLAPSQCCSQAVSRKGHRSPSKDGKCAYGKAMTSQIMCDVNPGEWQKKNPIVLHIHFSGMAVGWCVMRLDIYFTASQARFFFCVCASTVGRGWGRVGCRRQRSSCLFKEQSFIPGACLSRLRSAFEHKHLHLNEAW